MKAPFLLKTCNHIVLPPAIRDEKDDYTNHKASLLQAEINFEEGFFRLAADWQFMMNNNQHVQPGWLNCHTRNINIEASVCPACDIDLADDNNDGAVFVLEGTVNDNNVLTNCSGLMVLDKSITANGVATDGWNISIYLYEDNNDDCEIALKIPVSAGTAVPALN